MKMQFKAMMLFVLIAATSHSQAYLGESLWNKVVAFAGQKISNHKVSCAALVLSLGVAAAYYYRKCCTFKPEPKTSKCDSVVPSSDLSNDEHFKELLINLNRSNFLAKNEYHIFYHNHDYYTGFVFDLQRLSQQSIYVFLVRAPRMRIFYKPDYLVVFCANRNSIIYEARVYIKNDLTILPVVKEGYPKLHDIKSVALIKEEGGFKLKIS